ncbi:hypothetical protein DdX_18737 [Ditylenchus destructor]|uniref:Uncharacterized protein n=1 Tax=Ditylenchus destructor TaxID=166010 RepID=A0AAD4MJ32_9BILA|nr:hypothetical protein DdX_18737 [Ditylenchus destructor]
MGSAPRMGCKENFASTTVVYSQSSFVSQTHRKQRTPVPGQTHRNSEHMCEPLAVLVLRRSYLFEIGRLYF